MHPQAGSRTEKHQGLNQLTPTRMVAALTVAVHHFEFAVPEILHNYFNPIITAGPIAVGYFFTLSGFIMATVYHDLQWSGTIRYWVARLARIYPLYVLALPWFIWQQGWVDTVVFHHLTLSQAWVPGIALSLNGVGWSLSAEAFFYLLFPAVIMLVRDRSLAAVLMLTVIGWIATQAIVGFLYSYMQPVYPSPPDDFIHYFPVWHLISFIGGISAALVARKIKTWRGSGIVAIAALIAICILLMLEYRLPFLHMRQGGLTPLFALLVLSISMTDLPWMRLPFLVFLGEISYAFYLFHIVVYQALEHFLHLGPTTLPTAAFAIVCALAASMLLHWWVEVPVRGAIMTGVRRIEKLRPSDRS